MPAAIISLILSFAVLITPLAYAADGDLPQRRGPMTNIVFSGLAGAVLGLSTLSFYGRPQDRLNNITIGFAFGVIIGTVSSTYRAATRPTDFYGLRDRPEPWALMDDPRFARVDEPRLLNYEFTF